MSIIEIISGILLIVFSVAIIAVVLFQESHQHNAGGIMTGGGADTFLSKHKERSIDAFLAKWTRFIAIFLFILVMGTNTIIYFHLFGA